METALLVIDPQKIYTDPESEMSCSDATETIKRINKLIEHATTNKQLVILIRHVHKRDGSDLGRLFDFTGEAEEDFNYKEGSDEVEYDERLTYPKSAIELTKNGSVATSGRRLQDGRSLTTTGPDPPSCPATIRSNGVSSNQDSSSCVFGGTCGMP